MERIHRYIDSQSERGLAVLIFCVATVSALLFTALVYPRIAGPLQSRVAEDGYDRLAYGLYRIGTLTYFPSDTPTVMRGPAYPAFVAAFLLLDENLYPQSVQAAQALMHGATAAMCFAIAMMLWNNRRSSAIAAAVCAVHPFLLWYTARVVTETMAVLFFTLFVATMLWYDRSPSPLRASLAGVVGAAGALCKQTLLPLPVLTCVFFILVRKKYRAVHGMFVLLVTLLLVLPWTLRNYHLTTTIVPVHTLMGYNFWTGDILAEHYGEAPLSYMELITLGRQRLLAAGDTITQGKLHAAEQAGDYALDSRLFQASLDRYVQDPLFFARKLVLNAVMFWTISGTPLASVVTSLLQIPLLILSVIAGKKVIAQHGFRSIAVLALGLMGIYFLSHLPIYALARFGLVLVPTMLAYASGIMVDRKERAGV